MSQVLLDGKLVEAAEITPAKHKFVGTFRAPYNFAGGGYVLCQCGRTLQTLDETYAHWQLGHWDSPQYETIKTDE